MLNKNGTSIYDHMNREPFQVPIDMDKLAETVESAPCGTVRFLAALRRVRLANLARDAAEYRRRGDDDVAERAERDGDNIANVIEKLILSGDV